MKGFPMRPIAMRGFSFGIVFLAAACGDTRDNASPYKRTRGLSTINDEDGSEKSNKSGDVTDKLNEASDSGGLDCTGIRLHEGQLTCDADDIEAADAEADQDKDDDGSPGHVNDADKPSKPTNPPGSDDSSDSDGPADDEPTSRPSPTPMPTASPAPTPSPTNPPAADPNIIEFRIKAGTGRGTWNSKDELIVAKVGQTIRIWNDDSVIHRLHTGGAPCPHGPNIKPGGFYDCVASRTVSPGNRPPTYNHLVGPSASFWIKVEMP